MSFGVVKSSGSSMKSIQRAIDLTAHNIANINSTGYKQKRANFASVVSSFGETSFSGATINSTNSDFTQGKLKNTGITTDLAIRGRGMFTLQNGSGDIVYTRDGHFSTDSTGTLVNAQGYYVLSTGGGRVSIDEGVYQAVEINSAGELKALPKGATDFVLLDQLQLATFQNEKGLQSDGGNNYRESENSGAPDFSTALGLGTATSDTVLVSGALEGSNAELADSLTDMIAFQRSYQAVSRSATTANELLEQTINLAR